MTEVLKEARKRLVDEYGGRVEKRLRDHGGQFGWRIEVGGHKMTMVGKMYAHEDEVASISLPALARSLENERPILWYDDYETRFLVFDPEWVQDHGERTTKESKQAEVKIADVPLAAGVSLQEYLHGERPATKKTTKPSLLDQYE